MNRNNTDSPKRSRADRARIQRDRMGRGNNNSSSNTINATAMNNNPSSNSRLSSANNEQISSSLMAAPMMMTNGQHGELNNKSEGAITPSSAGRNGYVDYGAGTGTRSRIAQRMLQDRPGQTSPSRRQANSQTSNSVNTSTGSNPYSSQQHAHYQQLVPIHSAESSQVDAPINNMDMDMNMINTDYDDSSYTMNGYPMSQHTNPHHHHYSQQPAIQSAPSIVSVAESTYSNNNNNQQFTVPSTKPLSVESPLPREVHRNLGDRSYEKRKNAASEVEALVKSLAQSAFAVSTKPNTNMNAPTPSSSSTTNPMVVNQNTINESHRMISSLIQVLAKDFCSSMNSNYRKGGLIGLAATAIGLLTYHQSSIYLVDLIRPVLACFDDPESRVRYYACESLYNIIKVARKSILKYFNLVFDGLTKLFADVDVDVKNGAILLDQLVKDIVTESEEFSVEEFLPLLQNYIRRTNPYIRQLLVGWITVLDGIPDVNMIDYLPDFLDGVFNMLSDSHRDIRQAADSALSEFLREVRTSEVVESGPLVNILVFQCHSKDKLNRLTAISWLTELIHHPYTGGDALLPLQADILSAVMACISDSEVEICKVAERTNGDLLTIVKDTKKRDFGLTPLVAVLTKELIERIDVPTKMASLRWINMLLEKSREDMDTFIPSLMPVLLKSINESNDGVVLLTVQVLSRISLSKSSTKINDKISNNEVKESIYDDAELEMVLRAILKVFSTDRRLLEMRGSLIIRRLCVLLNARSVYIIISDILSSDDYNNVTVDDAFTLEFIATMVQTLNLILLTAAELNNFRALLAGSFIKGSSSSTGNVINSSRRNELASRLPDAKSEGAQVFASLFHCWCHSPISTFSLCLLSRAYDVAFALVKKFSEMEVTVGFLMQIEKLVLLLEGPAFVHLRISLLDVEAPYHTFLLKSCYGLLMLLPQSDAYRSLNQRLATVCNLRDNLMVAPPVVASPSEVILQTTKSSVYRAGLDGISLLDRFDEIMVLHRTARENIQNEALKYQEQMVPIMNKTTVDRQDPNIAHIQTSNPTSYNNYAMNG